MRNWSSTTVARRGELIEARELAGYVALLGGRRTGLLLVNLRDDDLEVVAISTSTPGQGVGHALMKQCVDQARACRCRRVWLITTNNNTTAIAFYQRVGMHMCAYYHIGCGRRDCSSRPSACATAREFRSTMNSNLSFS